MISSRGWRWSSHSIAVGRRRLEAVSIRSFSSSTVPNGPSRSIPLPLRVGAFGQRTDIRPQVLRASSVTRNGAAFRFQSTSPILSSATDATTVTTDLGALASAPFVAETFDGAIDLTSGSIRDIPEQIGYLKSLGLDYGWGPTSMVEWALEHIHVFAGTPWWASITITAVLIRVAMFYPYLMATDNAAKMATISHITKPLYEKMKVLSQESNSAGAMQVRRELQLINKRAGVRVLRSLVPMLQMPIGFGTFVLLRAMAKLPVPGLETGGTLWFTNLAVPDPYFLLPMATAGILHLVLRKGGETGVSNISASATRALSYGLPAVTLLFTWWLPAGLQLSFMISGLFSAIQARLFRSASFRRMCGMTPMPEKPDPFKESSATSPYQPHIVTITKAPAPSASSGTYEPPRKPTILSGFQKEVRSTIDQVKESGRKTMKSAREIAGRDAKAEGPNKKRSKAEIRKAEAYETKRRAEEQARLEEMDALNRRRRQMRRERNED